jgi:uncharacterized damage-inducible protein DinB
MRIIPKPVTGIPSFYEPYLSKVPDDGKLLMHLNDILTETIALARSLSEEKLNFRYAEGKWTIKDILVHLSDCERVIMYRSMRMGRGDKTNLPGFDENVFVENAHASKRTLEDILAELSAGRAFSIAFIQSLSEEALHAEGTANGYPLSCRLLVNHLYGHHRHHLLIIKERHLA